MSDAVLIALITNGTVIIVAVITRWMSHREHKETKQDVKQIKKALNGSVKEEDHK